jgi:hypothetical protein
MNLIEVSLCGKKFEVPKHILEKSPYFKDLFDEYEGKDCKSLYIPRSPIAFEHILTHLIYENYKVPEKYEEDMKYFQLHDRDSDIDQGFKVIIEDYKNLEKYSEMWYSNKHVIDDDSISSRELYLSCGFKIKDEVIIQNIEKYNGKKATIVGLINKSVLVKIENFKKYVLFMNYEYKKIFLKI